MTIFNSLGSNYDLAFALRAEVAIGSKKTRTALIEYLDKRYGGKTTLTYKGRNAIALALKALNIKGSKVAINGFTCIALYDAVEHASMTPVLLDIEKGTLDFSAAALEQALDADPSIRAVIIQNTLGYPCDGEKIAALCKTRGIFLIEDLAHSVGAIYKDGSEAGILGDATILSFGQDKAVDAISGGALVIRNTSLQFIEEPGANISFKRQLKDRFYPRFTWDVRTTYSWYGKAEHVFLRKMNMLPRPLESSNLPSRLPTWYTSLILRQFARLKKVSEHRRAIAEIYTSVLDKSVVLRNISPLIKHSSNLRFPFL
jgi:perosamine synthetase